MTDWKFDIHQQGLSLEPKNRESKRCRRANSGHAVGLGDSLATTKTSTLFKTEHVEVIRIVMHAGKEISEHKAPGEIIVQCLEGRVAFTAAGKTEVLGAGQMLYLAAEEPHAVRCLEDASFLVTILANR